MAKRSMADLAAEMVETEQPATEKPKSRSRRERVTVNLPVEVIERARDAVFWTPGATLSALAAEGLTKATAKLEKKRGEPFPRRSGNLPTGRPVKA